MENCDVCDKELKPGYKSVDVYAAKLIRRGYKKGTFATSVASEYGKFERVTVKVCSRHIGGLWNQRIIPGLIAFVVIFIPVISLLSLTPLWANDPRLAAGFALLITAGLVYLLVRRITLDGYIAGLLSQKAKKKQEKIEYFGKAKYDRLMRNLAKLDK